MIAVNLNLMRNYWRKPLDLLACITICSSICAKIMRIKRHISMLKITVSTVYYTTCSCSLLRILPWYTVKSLIFSLFDQHCKYYQFADLWCCNLSIAKTFNKSLRSSLRKSTASNEVRKNVCLGDTERFITRSDATYIPFVLAVCWWE